MDTAWNRRSRAVSFRGKRSLLGLYLFLCPPHSSPFLFPPCFWPTCLFSRLPTTFTSGRRLLLLRIPCGTIQIIDAVKTNDGGRASYITYVIRTGVSRKRPSANMDNRLMETLFMPQQRRVEPRDAPPVLALRLPPNLAPSALPRPHRPPDPI
jgi:hypothetical protein